MKRITATAATTTTTIYIYSTAQAQLNELSSVGESVKGKKK
jgi:hypothetical protein